MKITITLINGVVPTIEAVNNIVGQLSSAFTSAGLLTTVTGRMEGNKAGIFYSYVGPNGKRAMVPPMGHSEFSKFGLTYVWKDNSEVTTCGQRMDWVQRIYMNNLANDVLDANNVIAEIKTKFENKMARKEGDVYKLTKVMFVRKFDTGAIREFGKEAKNQTLSTCAYFAEGLGATQYKLPLKKFKNQLANAIAIAICNGEFNESFLTDDLVNMFIVESPEIIKYMIHNVGKVFLSKYAGIIEAKSFELAKYACELDPRNMNYFDSLDVVIAGLNKHGLACISLITEPSKFVIGYVKGEWPTYAKVLSDLDAIRSQNKNAPECQAVKPPKARKHTAKGLKTAVKGKRIAKAKAAVVSTDVKAEIATEAPKAKATPKAEKVVKTEQPIDKDALKAAMALVKQAEKQKAKRKAMILESKERKANKLANSQPVVDTPVVADAPVETPVITEVPAQPEPKTIVEVAQDLGKLVIIPVSEPVAEAIPEPAIVEAPKPTTKPTCKLVGNDGNAFAVMGAVTKALKKAGLGHLVKEYQEKAMSGSYDNLLAVSGEYVEIE